MKPLNNKKDVQRDYCPLRNEDCTCQRQYIRHGVKLYCNVPLCKAGKENRI